MRLLRTPGLRLKDGEEAELSQAADQAMARLRSGRRGRPEAGLWIRTPEFAALVPDSQDVINRAGASLEITTRDVESWEGNDLRVRGAL